MKKEYLELHIGMQDIYVSLNDSYILWEIINMDAIQKIHVDNKFLVLNTKDINSFYIINSEIGIYSYFVRITGTPCKH